VVRHLVQAVVGDVDDVDALLCGVFLGDTVDPDTAARDDPTPLQFVDDVFRVRRDVQAVDDGVGVAKGVREVLGRRHVDRPQFDVHPLEDRPLGVEVVVARGRQTDHVRLVGVAAIALAFGAHTRLLAPVALQRSSGEGRLSRGDADGKAKTRPRERVNRER